MKRSRSHLPPALHLGDGGRPLPGTFSLDVGSRQPMDCGSGEIGLPSTLAGGKGASYPSASAVQAPLLAGSTFRLAVGNCLPGAEGRGGESSGPQLPGILRASVRCSQSIRRMASRVGFISPQYFLEGDKIQDGDASLCPRLSPPRRLGDLDRSHGRILSHSYASGRPEMASFPVGRSDLPVSRTPFRAVSRTMDFHHGGETGLCTGEVPGYPSAGLSGRLAHHEPVPERLFAGYPDGSSRIQLVGVLDQPGKVGADPVTDIHLSGDVFRHGRLDCPAFSEKGGQAPSPDSLHFTSPDGFHPLARLHLGADGVYGSSGFTGPGPQTSASVRAEAVCGLSSGGLGRPHPFAGMVPVCDPSVVGHGVGLQRCSDRRAPPRPGPLYRCVQGGLGGTYRSSDYFRSVDDGAVLVAHQLAGARGSCSSSGQVSALPVRQTCSSVYRQHDSGGVHQQAGRLAVPVSLGEGLRDPGVVLSASYHDLGQVPSREAEHFGGCAQSFRYSASVGVDDHSRGTASPLGPGPKASGGPFCHKVLKEASGVRLAIPGPSGMASERSGLSLDGSGGVRLSSLSVTQPSNPESGDGGAGPSSSGRSSVAVAGLVSRSSSARPRAPHSSRTRARGTSAAPNRHSTRGAQSSEASRVEVVRDSLKRSGASSLTLDLVARSHRASTSSVYASHWKAWTAWCSARGVSSVAPRSIQVANHLSFMSSQGASVSSLRVRRSAISATLKQIGRSVRVGGVIAAVIKGAALKEAKARLPAPKWDLFLILEFLRSADFEPLSEASLFNVTRKALFLLLLATARRGSEVHALSGQPGDISFEPDGSASLRFRPDFLAKNQSPGQASPLVRVKALTSALAPDDPDSVNCPVRALRLYLARTQPIRSSSQKLLFISLLTRREKDLSKVTLARWVSSLIKQAYEWSRTKRGGVMPSLPLDSARAHETRAWASSLAVLRSRRLEEVLTTAYWRSEDVFINFYLRDVTALRQDGSRGLPALIAAGQFLSRT
ncbi:uncharacterized protein [Littorina saxatilis]|uniref:uncharacterized protein n=1 Tax=Littorina saxatilis TaxID=31220 RepID=UPI0038B45844